MEGEWVGETRMRVLVRSLIVGPFRECALLVEQLTNNGLTLAGPTLDLHWADAGPTLELHSISSIASIAAGWKDAIARLFFFAGVNKKCFI